MFLSVDTAAAIRKALKGITLKAAPGLARETTIAKSPEGIKSLVAHIAAQVYEFVLGFVKPGMREIEVAAEIFYQGRKRGSEGDAFGIILVGGEHKELLFMGVPANESCEKRRRRDLGFWLYREGI
jgi:Xaa-Pro aminopeptidase